MGANKRSDDSDPEGAAARKLAQAVLDEVVDTAARLLETFKETDAAKRRDVVWLGEQGPDGSRHKVLRVAPLSVGGLLRERLFNTRTTVLTSATLALGGSFDALARQWGLPAAQPKEAGSTPPSSVDEGHGPVQDPEAPRWQGLDVGSPFAHAKSGILYLARRLPSPGRDGLAPETLAEIEGLVRAAGGRTLGLFSSTRAAKQATEALRGKLDTPLLCQGDDSTMLLVKRFAEDPETSLFGTLSLWQGVDVPGPSLSCVIIDRIPFPRPDDPLVAARQKATDARAATASCRCRRRTRRSCSPRAPGGCCVPPTTAASSPSWTRGSRPRATAGSCGRACPVLGDQRPREGARRAVPAARVLVTGSIRRTTLLPR